VRDFDTTIKLLIQSSAHELLRQIGVKEPVTQWLNVELSRVKNWRADLAGRTVSGAMVHIELQSDNDPEMPLRMAEYALGILRRYKQYPQQLVLFVGNGKLTMKPVLEAPGMSYHYDQLDIRQLDGGKLIASGQISDNLLGVLAKLDDATQGIRKVLRKIAKLGVGKRNAALSLLFAAAEIRSLQHTVSEEVRKVPVLVKTSLNDKTFGPWIRKGMAKGMEKGMQRGMATGMEKGVQIGVQRGTERTLRLLLQQRFGKLPSDISTRLGKLSERKIELLLAGIMAGKSLHQLFPATASRR
jgi:hypothetical protein